MKQILFKRFTILEFSEENLTDISDFTECIRMLPRFSDIRVLDLSCNPELNPGWMTHLCDGLRLLPLLEILNLDNTNMDDEDLKILCQNFHLIPNLRELDLSGNRQLTNESILCLNECLKKDLLELRILKLGDIDEDEYFTYDAELLKLGLQYHPNIRHLQINGYLDFFRDLKFLLRTHKLNYCEILDRHDRRTRKPKIGIRKYRLKIKKFIWLIAKKKIDEFLLIEVFHKLK